MSLLEAALNPAMAAEPSTYSLGHHSASHSLARSASLLSTSPTLSLQSHSSVPSKSALVDAQPKKVKKVNKHLKPKSLSTPGGAQADTVASIVGLHRLPHEPILLVSNPALVPVSSVSTHVPSRTVQPASKMTTLTTLTTAVQILATAPIHFPQCSRSRDGH